VLVPSNIAVAITLLRSFCSLKTSIRDQPHDNDMMLAVFLQNWVELGCLELVSKSVLQCLLGGVGRSLAYCLGSACCGGSTPGVEPRSSEEAAQSPAQSLIPLTVPTSLQPMGATGVICFNGLPPTLGAAV
jgi:hypothetical protein